MNYSEEMIEWLRDFVPGHSRKQINAAFNDRFGTNLSVSQTTGAYKNRGFKTGKTGRFEKGMVSWCKGKKQTDFLTPEQIERTKATRYKPGSVPHNKKPVRSERVNIYGYIEIKIAEPSVWELKHRYVWQQAYGPIPERHAIIFKNRNQLDCSLDNLLLVPINTIGIMASKHLYSKDPEMTELGANLAKLMVTINEKDSIRNNGRSSK